MIRLLPIFALFFVSTAAMAQDAYKCKVNGTMVYQDRPCAGSALRSESMPPQKAATAPAPAPATTPSSAAVSDLERQKAFLAKGARERRIADLQYEIGRADAAISRLQAELAEKIAEVDRKKLQANNNLAGATYLNSLATEQQAITSRYQINISTLRTRIQALQTKLAEAKQE